MTTFNFEKSNLDEYRSIVLFGRNVATYKFALAKALLDFDMEKNDFISLERLAIPFQKHLVEHVAGGKRQATSPRSKLIYACKLYSEGKMSEDELLSITVKNGFIYVLDAFHNVKNLTTEEVFFKKDIRNRVRGIQLTDALYKIHQDIQFDNIYHEIEGRWNLVESSWEQENPNMIIDYDIDKEMLFSTREVSDANYLNSRLRIDVTQARNPLSGYQKGKCFYCYDDISCESGKYNTADVDHFIPISLQHKFSNVDLYLNSVWNLVLSCKNCNRGEHHAKWAYAPSVKLLERLEKRNNYYIESKHPLGENIIRFTGKTPQERKNFLHYIQKLAVEELKYEWYPKEIKGTPF